MSNAMNNTFYQAPSRVAMGIRDQRNEQAAMDRREEAQAARAMLTGQHTEQAACASTRNISGKLGAIGYSALTDMSKIPKLDQKSFLHKLNDLCCVYYSTPLKFLRGSASLTTMLHDLTLIEVVDSNTGMPVSKLTWEDLQVRAGVNADGKYEMEFSVQPLPHNMHVRILLGQIHPTHQFICRESGEFYNFTC